MFLYHGTSAKAWESIRESGNILPRSKTPSKTSNWTHTVESNPKIIYLAEGYGQYFSWVASGGVVGEKGVLIEIDAEKLNSNLLCADEDAIEQISRTNDNLSPNLSMEQRTKYYRNAVYRNKGNWADASLKALGTCGYCGKIPLESISRIAFLDFSKEPLLWLNLVDNSISLMSWKLLANRHKGVCSWIMDGKEKNMFSWLLPALPGFEDRNEKAQEAYRNLRKEAVLVYTM